MRSLDFYQKRCSGFTISEILVVSALTVVLMGIALSLLLPVLKLWYRLAERMEFINNIYPAVERLRTLYTNTKGSNILIFKSVKEPASSDIVYSFEFLRSSGRTELCEQILCILPSPSDNSEKILCTASRRIATDAPSAFSEISGSFNSLSYSYFENTGWSIRKIGKGVVSMNVTFLFEMEELTDIKKYNISLSEYKLLRPKGSSIPFFLMFHYKEKYYPIALNAFIMVD